MTELTPIQKARKNYEKRIQENPELKAQRSKQRNISSANSQIKFVFDLENLYDTLELTLAMILLREHSNYEKMTREQRREFLGRGKPQALLTDEQLYFIGDIMNKIRHR